MEASAGDPFASPPRIWELCADADRYLCVNPDDLRYFHGLFDGRPLADRWRRPEYSILNKSKKVADFTSWQMLRVILVTERAKDAVSALCGDTVEFLAFDVIKKKQLFAVNVLRVEDYLDRKRTEFAPGVPGLVLRAAFKAKLPSTLPPIFKLKPADDSGIYVSAAFGRMVVAEGLTGVRLRDPGKNAFLQITRGEELNEFPGITRPAPRRRR